MLTLKEVSLGCGGDSWKHRQGLRDMGWIWTDLHGCVIFHTPLLRDNGIFPHFFYAHWTCWFLCGFGGLGSLVSSTFIWPRHHFPSEPASAAMTLDLVYDLWPAILNKAFVTFSEWENKNAVHGEDKSMLFLLVLDRLCDFYITGLVL